MFVWYFIMSEDWVIYCPEIEIGFNKEFECTGRIY